MCELRREKATTKQIFLSLFDISRPTSERYSLHQQFSNCGMWLVMLWWVTQSVRCVHASIISSKIQLTSLLMGIICIYIFLKWLITSVLKITAVFFPFRSNVTHMQQAAAHKNTAATFTWTLSDSIAKQCSMWTHLVRCLLSNLLTNNSY